MYFCYFQTVVIMKVSINSYLRFSSPHDIIEIGGNMKKIFNFLFSRMVIVGLLLIIQVLFLIFIIWKFSKYYMYVSLILSLLSLLVVLWINRQDDNPAYKLAWTTLILVIPVFGGLFYILFGHAKMPRKARKRQRIAEAKLQSLLTQEERIKDILEYENIDIKNQATYIKNYSSFPIHQNTKTKYYKIGEDFYQDLLKDLKQAKHYIFMEYFIVAQGEMWDTNISNQDHYEDYLPHMYHSQSFETDGYVQPYGDSPLDRETVGENIYLNIINKAKHYIYIYTPYLIIDHEMMTALCLASKSGVDVRIMTPGIPDKKIIFWVSQSYYEPLLKAGVKILEYTPGFIHGKVVLANDEVATVGTVNLDFRSLYLHFECGVYLYQCSSLKEIKKDMLTTFKQGKEITLSFCQNRHWTVRFIQSIARLFAPLL